MFTLFSLHVLLFSVFAIGLTALPKHLRRVCFYAYLSIILLIGGFLGNAYSLPVFGSVIVSGGNLVYGAFMMTSILFVLAERDSFILRRIIQLVVVVDIFNILLSLLITRTFSNPAAINPNGTPAALFENSIPFIILGGILIILELGIMLYVFELIKRFKLSPVLTGAAYLITFVAILCFDGIAFPLIAFGTSEVIIGIVVGGLSGKLLTAVSYSLAILTFMVFFPKRFSAYLDERVFTWKLLRSTSGEILRDIEQKDAKLSQSEARIFQSAKLAGLGYAIANRRTGKVLECDEVYAKMHGMTVAEFTQLDINKIAGQIVYEADREKARGYVEQIARGEAVVSELRHVLPTGEIRSIRKIFSPLDPMDLENDIYEVVGQDVTETRQLQDQLFQSQKMDAIGKLTGGVAHDFNNLLAVTLGNLELLEDEIDDPDLNKLITSCINSTMRGSDLTRNMLSFARKAPLEPVSVNLNELIGNMHNWIERTLPSSIEVETSLFADLWETQVDLSSAESGLLNLIINARDAMPNGGKLTFETSNIRIDRGSVDFGDDEIKPGQYVLLSVTDTGEGISAENLKNIFEPFFTTKGVGKGSGLGLSMLDGFMKQSNGMVRVKSELGVGTTFNLYFRAETATKTIPQAATSPGLETVAQNSPTILLVEDNLEVLSAFKATLTKSGYRVISADSGDQALEIFKASPVVDLLLTDIVMPGAVQGTDLAQEIRELQPDLPVIFMSGYSSEPTVQGDDPHPNDIRLMKPVRRKILLRSISKALSTTGEGQT